MKTDDSKDSKNPDSELNMYIKYDSDGNPLKYAFGEPWVAMALYLDDRGYDTEKEAISAWMRENTNE